MSSQGPNFPNVAGVNTSVGSVTWANPNFIKADDTSWSMANVQPETRIPFDYSVRLLKGGTISGDNKAKANPWPPQGAVITYGGADDLWGVSLNASDVNSENFGIVLSATTDAGDPISYYLLARDFGWDIPAGSIIDGIEVEMEQNFVHNLAGETWVQINYYKMTVYYHAGVTSSPNRTSRKNFNGYLAFVQQYFKHKMAGTTPWASPNGDLLL